VGAIDDTHISAWILESKQGAFRGRKSYVSQNVFAACDFDMLFTFVYIGWEGIANDSCVFYDAMAKSTNKFPIPPEGTLL
jgi:hypothetical protein